MVWGRSVCFSRQSYASPIGRLQSEVRTGQVAYLRNYEYNPDGSRYSVSRSDALNGSHWELYFYDEVSGRLAEEGRLVRIERDYENGNKQVAYEYGYNSDGGKVWKKDYLNQQEYRYLCRIGCGGTPMRVYNRAMGNASWTSVEDYLPAGNALGYNTNWQFRYAGGELVMMGTNGVPTEFYPTDSNGVNVQSVSEPCACGVAPAQVAVCRALGYGGCEGRDRCDELSIFGFNELCRGGDEKKTYKMCVDFCTSFANAYCKGAGVGLNPWIGKICKRIAKKGCKALCRETNQNFDPFERCWLLCSDTQPGSEQCVDCCNAVCWGGGLSTCYKECATRDIF